MRDDVQDGWVEPELEPWVPWDTTPSGVAYSRGRLLVRGEEAARFLGRYIDCDAAPEPLFADEEPALAWYRVDCVESAAAAVELLRAEGFVAQPDHVFFAHACDPCCGPHPAETFDALASDPYRSNPYRSNPYRSNPYRSNPFWSNPYRSNPFWSNSERSSARPALARDRSFPACTLPSAGAAPRIMIIDTGLAAGTQLPALLDDPARITGATDEPDVAIEDPNGSVVWAQDGWLDPVAGHGTFIAGLIEQIAPGCEIRVSRAVWPLGDAREIDILKRLDAIAALAPAQRPHLLSLSFGGSMLEHTALLRSRIAKLRLAGVVVVASAGNDGTSEPQYPAALDGVVAVGAVGPDGPTPWTNYGSWVDACAPGLDLVSAFFAAFEGKDPRINTEDPDHFEGWARWSGTSFSAPVVVGMLAREMVLTSCTAEEAVARVVGSPTALRIRCLGTVVNL